MKKFVLQLFPYPTSLILRLHLDEKHIQQFDENTLATTSLLENNIILVDFKLTASIQKNKQQLFATAVHESVHVVQFVQSIIDNQIDVESAAYLTQKIFTFITARILKTLKK